MICDRCFEPSEIGVHGVGQCPYRPRPAHIIQPDDIPGGLTIYHGLCNEDDSPRTYYSHSAIKLEAEKRGLMRWSDAWSEDRTKDARVRADWYQSPEAKRAKALRDEERRERALERQRERAG